MSNESPRAPRSSNQNEVRPFDPETSFVVLQSGALVHIDNVSLLNLQARGLAGRFYSYQNGSGRAYVAVNLPSSVGRGTTTAATLISQRGASESVVYVNGNRFDLRRKNLRVVPRGVGRRKDMEGQAIVLFPSDPAQRASWLDAEIKRLGERGKAARTSRIDHANQDDPEAVQGAPR